MTPRYVAPCPKCGEPDPSIRYQRWTVIYDDAGRFDDEHFAVTCRRCAYHWPQRISAPDTRPPDPHIGPG